MARTGNKAMGQLAGFAALGALLGIAAPAAAQQEAVKPAVIGLAEGFDVDGEGKNMGPGNEQASTIYVNRGDRHFLVSVYMSSDVEESYWQCKCSSVELTEAGPQIVANGVQLTYNEGGYRPCNRPRLAADDDHIVLVYGSDVEDPDSTASYATGIDEMCGATLPTIKVSDSPDNDSGAPVIAKVTNGKFIGGYHDNTGNDTAMAFGLEVLANEDGSFRLNQTFRRGIVSPANIARPTIAVAEVGGEPIAMFCSAKGNERPPEVGVECAALDPITGDIHPGTQQVLAQSDKASKIFYNQPTIAALEFGRFALEVLESNGAGRKDNEKGSNKATLLVVQASKTALIISHQEKDLAFSWQTHSSLCTGRYGAEGDIHMAVMGAPVTGVGQPKMNMVKYDASSGITIDKNAEWITAQYGDSGYLSNMNGANPGNQGRDFLYCIGDVPNPGYVEPGGVTEGRFMPSVKSLFVMPVAGKKPGEPKNSMFLSLIPGESNEALSAEAPDDVGPIVEAGPMGGALDQSNTQAGGCSVGGGASSGSAAALLALGLLLVVRRRREV